MNTRPYSEALAAVEALAGATLATQERARVKIFLNRRAKKAYNECEYWPRFYVVGEERIVSEKGLLPYSETGLRDIGTLLRVHATEPFRSCGAAEYINCTATDGGVLITDYRPALYGGYGPIRVQGAASPAADGVYYFTSLSAVGNDGVSQVPSYQRRDNTIFNITGGMSFTASIPPEFTGYRYTIGPAGSSFWRSDFSDAYTTPDLADGSYTAFGAAVDAGSISVTAVPTYSAFVTYKAEIPTTYGDGDGEESDIPEEFFEYMFQGAYADFLRSDGNSEKAFAEEAIAAELLQQQLEKVDRQGGSHVKTRIVTHLNCQSR
jgi:hypothetical protein